MGTLMGIGLLLYVTRDSSSWVSLGKALGGIFFVKLGLVFEGDSGEVAVAEISVSSIR